MNRPEILKDIEFHDRDVASLNIDFSNKKIVLALEELIDEPQAEKVFTFEGVTNITTGGFEEYIELNQLELYGANFSKKNDVNYVEFIFLLGFGKPSWQLNFNFEKVNITREFLPSQ